MSKRTTTRWYIGAWVMWVIAFTAAMVMMRGGQSGSSLPPGVTVAYLVMGVAGLVMFVMWIGALVRLARLHAWGWFASVLVLQLVGMVAYAAAGPEERETVVMRPSTT
jgi:uncharacterized membrane protein YhaH (DUF805 family)